ncbi:MAG TPA: amino acid adenylation domain-containing protein [Candidatus Acidoferrum sp.]|nr:amino acid adenylation domain-containing protein [Candidatus Acidoferrum sp.]
MLTPPQSRTLPRARYPRRLLALLTAGALSDLRVLPQSEPAAPLTTRQEGMWLLERLAPCTGARHLSEVYRVSGDLDRRALARAFGALAMRHAILRTTFAQHDDRPIQTVQRSGRVPLEELDLTSVPAEDREAEAARRCAAFAERSFDIENGPPARAALMKLADGEYLVQVAMHGLVGDEASFEILWRDLGSLYCAALEDDFSALAPLPIQFGDFAAWHRRFVDGAALSAQRAYWSETFEGGLPALDLPYDRRPGLMSTGRSERVEEVLPPHCMDELARIAARAGCTTFVALLTAYVAFLHRYTGDRTIAAGFPLSGRTLPESEALIGSFTNTVMLTAQVDPHASLMRLMQTVAHGESDAYDHQDVPIEHVMRAIRAGGHASGVQTTLTLRERQRGMLVLPGATVTYERSFGSSVRSELGFEVRDGDAPTVSVQYDADSFARTTARRMAANFATFLRGIVAEPDTPIATLPLLAEAERALVVDRWNATEAPRTGTQTMHRLVESQVPFRRSAPAVLFNGGSVTYDELDRRANRIARTLRVLGVGRGSLVAICLERSVDAIVTLLAVVKAGGAFVPLDPAYPDERLAMMVQDAAPCIVITTGALATRFAAESSLAVTTVEELESFSVLQRDHALGEIAGPDDAAYVIYTSGSTGVPKGVVVTHRSACNMLLSARTDFGLGERDRVLQLAPLSFDPSVWQIFGTLALGASIVLPSSLDNHDAGSIARDVVAHRVTVLIAVPALLALVFEVPELRSASSLRAVVSGGSALTAALRDRCAAILGVPLYNVYGPTETTIHVATYRCGSADERDVIPIGRPIENARMYILNEDRLPVPIGVAGELYVGGVAVARGYLRRPDLTAERFVPDPFTASPGQQMYRTGDIARFRSDGNIEFLGRDDEQVKVRGVRIELAEVEAAIKRHPSVAQCAVVLQERDGDERLVAFVVPRDPRTCEVVELRAHARTTLAPAAQPSIFVAVDALPELPNGKVDRRALAERVFVESADPVPALAGADSLVGFLIDLWEDLLGVDGIGTHDDFFALGGHSLLAARAIARIEAAFGTRVPFSTFFADPTIGGLAHAIRSKERASLEAMVPVQTEGDRTPFFFLHGDYTGVGLYARRFAGALGEGQPIYAIPPHGADGGTVPETIEEMARDSLRLIRNVQPRGPYLLGGYCMGGLVALEMARQLHASGEQIIRLVLVEVQRIRTRFGYLEDAAATIAERVGIEHEISRRWITSRRNGARRVWRRLHPRPTRSAPSIPQPDPATAHVEPEQERALHRYVWRRVPVHATMLCARDDAGEGAAAIARNWAGLFETLDVRLIPGDHVTSLTRNLPSLTAELGNILRCSAEAG